MVINFGNRMRSFWSSSNMKVLVRGLLLLLTLVSCCLSAPAKLDLASSPHRDRNTVGGRGYSYAAPPSAAGPLPDHFELAGPPPAPLLPHRPKETHKFFPPSTRPSSPSTSPAPPPAPPSGLYGAPHPITSHSEPSSLNSGFVSLDFDLEVPEVVEVSPTPATLPTPKGFSPPPPPEAHKSLRPYMPYQIAWRVRGPTAGHRFSHTETSGGEDVRGEYRVLLPDGRTQIVSFRADPSSGYNAAVTYTKVTA